MPEQSTIPEHHRVTGSWRVTIFPAQGTPALGLATFGADGTVVNAFPPVERSPAAPGGVVFVSSGHGAWEAIGLNRAVLTFVALGADGEGNPDGTGSIRVRITLSDGGQTFSGEYDATMTDPAGNTVATEQGTVQGARIVAEAPDMTSARVTPPLAPPPAARGEGS